jgi:uncharacterized protein YkwD
MRRLVVALLGVVLAGTGMAPAAPLAPAATPESTYAAAAVKATNTARVNHERKELRTSTCLRRFAARHAARMAAKEAMYHQELGPIMEGCGLSTAGENVAYGYPTGRAVVWKGWMRSEGHRANILRRAFRLVAVGARRSDDGTWYVAQVFGRKT